MAKSSKKRAPWDKSNPRQKAGKASKHLTPAKKKAAKASAKKAGRPYPNLVDNMRAAKSGTTKRKRAKTASKKAATTKAAKKSGTRKSAKKRSKKKSTKKKSGARKSADRDPRGGLTAAGRRTFAKKDGSHLKPGVRKAASDMTPTEMRRKGSWAVRFYGRDKLPPLVDDNGEPTRHALSAHAWGEPVPKTKAAARKIAAKGRKLLERYHRSKAA